MSRCMCKFTKEESVRRQELNWRRDGISRQQPCLAEAFGGCFVEQDQLLLKLQPATTIFQAVDSISGNDGNYVLEDDCISGDDGTSNGSRAAHNRWYMHPLLHHDMLLCWVGWFKQAGSGSAPPPMGPWRTQCAPLRCA